MNTQIPKNTAYIEIVETDSKTVAAVFDAQTNTLTLENAHGGEIVAKFTGEKIDSGALVGHLPEGQIVMPRNSERFPGIDRALTRADIIEMLPEIWSAYGGLSYQAARVLIAPGE